MRVYLVRHAEAAPGEPDELRPLTLEGEEAARAVGRRLAAEARVAAVVTSPLLRARQTAEAIGRACSVHAQTDEGLAPGATADDLRSAVAGRAGEVVVVGHQPDCGRIAAELRGGTEPAFPPAGVAVLEI